MLAHALKRFAIKLFNFVFLSNHGHLLLQAPEGMLPHFMQFLLGNVARKLGTLHDWHDKFWGRRYSAEAVLDDDAVNGRMIYIFQHGVKEGLVEHHGTWPGLKALPQLLGQPQASFNWPILAGQNEAAVPWELQGAATLTLSPLPCLSST